VTGVGEKREAPGQQTANHLDDGVTGEQYEHKHERPPARSPTVFVRV